MARRRRSRGKNAMATFPVFRSPKLVASGAPEYTVGRRRVRLDLTEGVGVADGEVVEPARRRAAPGDGEISLVAFDVEGLAVDQPDADALVVCCAGRQRLRQFRLTGVGRARAREHCGVLAQR